MRDWLTHHSWVTRQSWRNPQRTMDFWAAGRMTVAPRVIICHSTETIGFPGYNGGAAAPHFTITLVTGETRQHIPLSWGARALAVSSGGITDRTVNISGTIQIEVIGAVTPGYPSRYGHYDLPGRFPTDQRAQRFLARLWRAIADETGIPLQTSGYARWVPYPASYGARAAQRLDSAEFRDARGLLGHQHVVANDHGDGVYGRAINGRAPDIESTLALARDGAPTPAPDPDPDPRDGFTPEQLRYAEEMLDALGVPGGDVWEKTEQYQTWAGLDPVDSLPGPQTTRHLEETMINLADLPAATAKEVWTTTFDRPGMEPAYASTILRYAAHRQQVDAIAVQQAETAAQVTALMELVKQLPGGQDIDLDALAEAAGRSAARSIAEYTFRLEMSSEEAEEGAES